MVWMGTTGDRVKGNLRGEPAIYTDLDIHKALRQAPDIGVCHAFT